MQMNATSNVINKAMEVLSSYGATCIPDNDNILYVNHSKVLVRKTYSPNDCVCIELLHETTGCRWVKSWGLTSDAPWLLHIDHANVHWWFYLPTLRQLITDGIIKCVTELRNNSVRTRNSNGPSSNVVSVWVNKFDESDFLFNGTQDYSWFLGNMKRGDTL